MSWFGENTGFILAKDPVTVTRHEFIKRISNGSRKNLSPRSHLPDAAEFSAKLKNGIRPYKDSFVWFAVVQHNANCVEIVGVSTMPTQDRSCEFALQ